MKVTSDVKAYCRGANLPHPLERIFEMYESHHMAYCFRLQETMAVGASVGQKTGRPMSNLRFT